MGFHGTAREILEKGGRDVVSAVAEKQHLVGGFGSFWQIVAKSREYFR
jgi:hypothetical protein